MLPDRIRGLHAAGAGRLVAALALLVIAVAVVLAPSAGAITAAYETGVHAGADRSPGLDDCPECGEACVRTVTCTVPAIVGDAAFAPLAAKWAWSGAPAELSPSRAIAPLLRPPATGLPRGREPG